MLDYSVSCLYRVATGARKAKPSVMQDVDLSFLFLLFRVSNLRFVVHLRPQSTGNRLEQSGGRQSLQVIMAAMIAMRNVMVKKVASHGCRCVLTLHATGAGWPT